MYQKAAMVLLLVMLGGALGQEAGAHQDMPGMQVAGMEMGAGSPLAELQGEEFDVAFMSMMIAHHRGAIEMAESYLERAENPRIQAAAEAVITAQGPEIEQMTAWLEEWYGRDMDPMMAEMMQSNMGAMMDQMEAGEDAEQSFLQMMTEHHMSALDMAQLALVRTEQPELRTLARDIIVAQAEEIYQYQEWLADGTVR